MDSGVLKIGAYALPFYVMPFAEATLRNRIGLPHTPEVLEQNFRCFLRAAFGTAFPHANGIIHRDLKPKNILLAKNEAPWVADLGIAHINPEFVSVGLRTIQAEKLLNRDYYAPEQRFGNSTDVDHTVDIYALGCILYELLSGTPPVRHDSPALSSFNPAFETLESVVSRMIAYSPKSRYSHLED